MYYRKDNTTLVVKNEQHAGAHKTTGATCCDYNTQAKQVDDALVYKTF
jgi:hypothetical protein